MATTEPHVSPFSLHEHDWSLEWQRITANPKYDKPYEPESEREQKALEAIASVGVIGRSQLKKVFEIDKNRLSKMLGRHLIAEHTIKRNGKNVPIYTISKRGANHVMPEYISNYWLNMQTHDVLKALSFFQFSYLLKEENYKIIPAPDPFQGGLRIGEDYFYVYVAKGSIDDLTLFLKWKPQFQHRIFIICEQLNQLKPLEIFLETNQLKLRAILEHDLPYLNDGQQFHDLLLFHYDKNQPQERKWQQT